MTREDPLRVVLEQAEDEGLWFVPQSIGESHLQVALLRLRAAVESAAAPPAAPGEHSANAFVWGRCPAHFGPHIATARTPGERWVCDRCGLEAGKHPTPAEWGAASPVGALASALPAAPAAPPVEEPRPALHADLKTHFYGDDCPGGHLGEPRPAPAVDAGACPHAHLAGIVIHGADGVMRCTECDDIRAGRAPGKGE